MPVEMTLALRSFSIACRFSILACAKSSFEVYKFPCCGPLELQPLEITSKTRPDAPKRGEAAWSLVRLRYQLVPTHGLSRSGAQPSTTNHRDEHIVKPFARLAWRVVDEPENKTAARHQAEVRESTAHHVMSMHFHAGSMPETSCDQAVQDRSKFSYQSGWLVQSPL